MKMLDAHHIVKYYGSHIISRSLYEAKTRGEQLKSARSSHDGGRVQSQRFEHDSLAILQLVGVSDIRLCHLG